MEEEAGSRGETELNQAISLMFPSLFPLHDSSTLSLLPTSVHKQITSKQHERTLPLALYQSRKKGLFFLRLTNTAQHT